MRFLAAEARIALIAACADASQVVEVMFEPTGSFINPKITFGLLA
jgi:hypothetical protein